MEFAETSRAASMHFCSRFAQRSAALRCLHHARCASHRDAATVVWKIR